jgi:hypothetical protein
MMQAKKTHEQQLRIIEKRDDTSNAGSDFDAKSDLARNDAAKKAHAEGSGLRTGLKDLTSDRGMIRGQSQESQHHKRAGH